MKIKSLKTEYINKQQLQLQNAQDSLYLADYKCKIANSYGSSVAKSGMLA